MAKVSLVTNPSSSVFEFNGGSIINNTTSTSNGGGIYIQKESSYINNGGNLSLNTPNDVFDNN